MPFHVRHTSLLDLFLWNKKTMSRFNISLVQTDKVAPSPSTPQRKRKLEVAAPVISSRFNTPLVDAKQPPLTLNARTQKSKALETVPKIVKPAIPGTVLGSTFQIPKAQLSASQQKKIKSDLTVKCGDDDGHWKSKEICAFEETDTAFHVPRFYGVEQFGPPSVVKLSRGVPMQSGLECKVVLQDKRRQPEAFQHVLGAFSTPNQWGGFLSLPCGYGKTDTAIKISIDLIKQLEGEAKRTLIVVPDSGLLKQWQQRIAARVPGAKVGILRQNKMEIQGSDFVIAMVHSLAQRDDYIDLDTFGLMILDEAHHMSAPVFSCALRKVPAKYILALSATPVRPTEAETQLLNWYMGPVLFKPTRPANENVLVRMLWYTQTPGRDVSTKNRKPLTHIMLKRMVDDKQRTAILLDFILEYYKQPNRNILVISKRLQQLDGLAELLRKCGVHEGDIGVLKGEVSEEQREVLKHRRIVLAIEKLGKEGLDAPHLNTLVVALPLSGIEQPTGRIQRTLDEHQEWNENGGDYLAPHVVYLVDPYSLYEGMSWKNFHQFKSFGYTVQREDLAGYQLRHVRLQ